MRHAFITVQSIGYARWKQMTILNIPLLIHPHFEREDYQEEEEEEEDLAEKKDTDDTDKVVVIAVEPVPVRDTVAEQVKEQEKEDTEEEKEQIAPLPFLPRTVSLKVHTAGDELLNGGRLSPTPSTPIRHGRSSRTFSRMSIGSLNLTIDGSVANTPAVSRRQSVRIISVGPAATTTNNNLSPNNLSVGVSSGMFGRRTSLPMMRRSLESPLPPISPLSISTASKPIDPTTPSFDLDMQQPSMCLQVSSPFSPLSPQAPLSHAPPPPSPPLPMQFPLRSISIHPSPPASPVPPLVLPSPSIPPPVQTLDSSALSPRESTTKTGSHTRRHSVEALTASTHRIDHRDVAQTQGQRRVASEFAFEVGGTCAARACKRAGPFPPFTPQDVLSAA
jgi:hypothetical protein